MNPEHKKRSSIQKMREFLRIPGRNHKNMRLCYKSAKKQFLLTNSRVITNILGVSGLELHSSGTEPVTFFGTQFSLGGHNSRLGGPRSDLGGHGPGLPPVVSCLLQIYNNLSYLNYRIFVKEILLEIDFIEEMRTI